MYKNNDTLTEAQKLESLLISHILANVVPRLSSTSSLKHDVTRPKAGKFGYISNGLSKCDIPLITFKTALDFIKSYPVKPEFIFYGVSISECQRLTTN